MEQDIKKNENLALDIQDLTVFPVTGKKYDGTS